MEMFHFRRHLGRRNTEPRVHMAQDGQTKKGFLENSRRTTHSLPPSATVYRVKSLQPQQLKATQLQVSKLLFLAGTRAVGGHILFRLEEAAAIDTWAMVISALMIPQSVETRVIPGYPKMVMDNK